jgi:hypothetical protein
MAKFKLGSEEFDVDWKQWLAGGCGVTDADCIALGLLMRGVEFQRVKYLDLVSLFSFFVLGAQSSQMDNQIGDAGASHLGQGMKFNSSVQILRLVRC